MGVKRIDSGKQNLLRIIKELKKSGKGDLSEELRNLITVRELPKVTKRINFKVVKMETK